MARHRGPPRAEPTDPLWYVAAVGVVVLIIVASVAILVGHSIKPDRKGVIGEPTLTDPTL